METKASIVNHRRSDNKKALVVLPRLELGPSDFKTDMVTITP